MASFKGVDFYNVSDLFSEEELMIRDTVREFVEKEVVPIIDAHAQAQTFPMGLIPKIGELGLFGAHLQGYGCAGLNNVAYGLIMQELERGDSGLRSFCSVQGGLVMYPIHTFGSDEQKERWLPKMTAGEAIGAFGLTEPDFGSNPAGMLTKAVRDRDDYILNGTKMWITNASIADVTLVWARIDEENSYGGFLVEKGTKGFSTPQMKGKWSLRASITSELVLEDVRLPAGARLPKTPGLRGAFMCLNQARYGIAWGAVGAAMSCYETAVNYAKSRIQFDRPIASFQLVQRKLAHMLIEITKAQLVCWRLGRLKDEGKLRHQQISLAKMNNVQMALDIARNARDLLGANGILDEYPVMRHMCNLESVNTYEGTYDMHTLILGQDITGIPAFT
ncbi:MAG: acyl-CoA dehydrogenase family protein [Candidatus Tectomicrobia bacterium]|nr:acyl-CoA dehydrogenase family protein [Candidatus Tectomicrobia bacterium]